MADLMGSLKRTHMCTEVTTENMGQEVVLMGWVNVRRDLGGVIFVDLRDRTGLIQVVFNAEYIKNEEIFKKSETIRTEYVLAIKGEVKKRTDETINAKMKTGEVEIYASDIKILAKSQTPPFALDDGEKVSESLRLKYRFLDLRRPEIQDKLIIRHNVCQIARNYLSENGYLEIETPMLGKSSPEGARDYLVPSRVHEGMFYALPQSPQQFKQILMVSGFDRYFQITKCFRDEDLRADRQPEFTQIDEELSFVDADDVMTINEGLVKKVWKEVLDLDIETPFKRMTYKEAMDRYGSDKPDTRFGLELVDVSDLVKDTEFKVFAEIVEKGGSARCINAKGCNDKFSRRDLDSLVNFVKIYKAKGMAWINVLEDGTIKSPIAKFFTEEQMKAILDRANAEPNDLIMFVSDIDNEIVFNSLGQLRIEVATRMNMIDESKYNFLWVTEFPLLEWNPEEKRFTAKHHPFTMPMDEDLEFLESDPGKVRAKAYDIVLNGYEIGGGSIRINDLELQERMFTALGLTLEKAREDFNFLLEAFKFGAPPHGGMAFGLDRMIMLLTKTANIKDVIAFPKVQNASCLMSNAPSPVEVKQLKELHIRVNS
jgi:aspartyl-tRNA synthetase